MSEDQGQETGAEPVATEPAATPATFTQAQVDELLAKKETEIKKQWTDDVAGLKTNFNKLKEKEIRIKQQLRENELQQSVARGDQQAIKTLEDRIRGEMKAEYEETISTQQTKLDNLQKTLDNNNINTVLGTCLSDLKVKSDLGNALKAEILLENEVAVQDGQVSINGKPVTDFFAEWQKSERSKAFIVAEPSSGGGSSGSYGVAPDAKADLFKMQGASMFKEALKQKRTAK